MPVGTEWRWLGANLAGWLAEARRQFGRPSVSFSGVALRDYNARDVIGRSPSRDQARDQTVHHLLATDGKMLSE